MVKISHPRNDVPLLGGGGAERVERLTAVISDGCHADFCFELAWIRCSHGKAEF
jgi:hypothetical protein